ncbi:MAG: GNAT family N-acetyltransferase [Clostridia bacterium]|nr:GNAT family N-acetyltransferase [Clostridia bacterium]MBQ9744070.1 GNAT family N-acetyltransferase [Clostridia bacterium]
MNTIKQPDFIIINNELRLRRYDGKYEAFLAPYRDPYICKMSEGIFDESEAPDLEYVKKMCEYLSYAGELYYIEVLENGEFIPIGDVTVKDEHPPISIWYEGYRGKGIGKLVMKTVISRLKDLGYNKIHGTAIYKWNPVSQKMHEALGFVRIGETEDEILYELDIT